jgi:transposase
MRCGCIPLKSEGHTSKEVASVTDMCEMSVKNRLARYVREGIGGLRAKSGRGRNPVINESEDKAAILSAIKANRQRMRTAKAEWEAASGKKVCADTFKAFLKSLADDINI